MLQCSFTMSFGKSRPYQKVIQIQQFILEYWIQSGNLKHKVEHVTMLGYQDRVTTRHKSCKNPELPKIHHKFSVSSIKKDLTFKGTERSAVRKMASAIPCAYHGCKQRSVLGERERERDLTVRSNANRTRPKKDCTQPDPNPFTTLNSLSL